MDLLLHWKRGTQSRVVIRHLSHLQLHVQSAQDHTGDCSQKPMSILISWPSLGPCTSILCGLREEQVHLQVHMIKSGPPRYSGFPGGPSGKDPTCQCRGMRCRVNPWVRKIPWRRAWQPIPVSLPGESHGHWSLVGYRP